MAKNSETNQEETKNSKTKRRSIVFMILALVWMGVIFYFSHQPGEVSSNTSGGISTKIADSIIEVFHMDSTKEAVQKVHDIVEVLVRKSAHMTEFAILAVLLLGVVYGREKVKHPYILSMLLAVCYAASDEVHQLFVPGRAGMLRDVGIDAIGAGLGILLICVIVNLINRTK